MSFKTLIFLLGITPLLAFAQSDTAHQAFVIHMTPNGFEPKELTVTLGDKVSFVNDDSSDRWPASNLHPTHLLYPEFDPERHITPGESWQFTFDKPGSWDMHDHLFPHFTGKITVLADPSQETAATTPPSHVSFWTKLKSFFRQWLEERSEGKVADGTVNPKLLTEFEAQSEKGKYSWLEERARTDGPKLAWAYVLAAYSTPAGVVGNPHDMAHLVGQLIFKRYGLDGLSICNPSFAFGCYHGLIQVAFANDDEGQYQKDLLAAQAGCQILGTETSASYRSCIHGIGHGVATYRDFSLEKALKDCDLLSSQVQVNCDDGIFMEFALDAPANAYKSEDPLYPCNTLDSKYRGMCARSQIQVMRLRFHLTLEQIAQACSKSGDEDINYYCVDALGSQAGQSNPTSPSLIIADCGVIKNPKNNAHCLATAAGELAFQNTLNWRENGEKVCDSLAQDFKKACLAHREQVAQDYNRN